MSLPYDPWRNPELAPRRKPAQRAWRAGRNRVFAALLATACLYAGYTLVAGEHGILRLHAKEKRGEDLRAKIAATDERIRQLDRKLDDLPHTIEEEARVEYGYIGANEEVYEILPGDSITVLLRRRSEGVGADTRDIDSSQGRW